MSETPTAPAGARDRAAAAPATGEPASGRPALAAAAPERAGTIYQPDLVVVEAITDETPDTRTYRLRFADEAKAASFSFRAGQFGEYSVFGAGESTFCIASPPTRTGYIECTVKAAGKVTGSLREVDVGDVLGFRGPYGNVFPVENGRAATWSSSRAASAWRRCAASSGTCSTCASGTAT